MYFTPVAHFEQRYMISPSGLIMNLANNQCLTPIENPNGYVKVGLAKGDGNHEQHLVHILVARHFLPNPYDYPQVNHKNGVKTDCKVSNLEWCSGGQNAQHALMIGLRPGYMSANDKEAYLIRVLAGEMVADIANAIGRRPETLHKMLRDTATRLGQFDQWKQKMKENRCAAAIRNLSAINA